MPKPPESQFCGNVDELCQRWCPSFEAPYRPDLCDSCCDCPDPFSLSYFGDDYLTVATNDDTPTYCQFDSFQSEITHYITGGQQYMVVVQGYDLMNHNYKINKDEGSYELYIGS